MSLFPAPPDAKKRKKSHKGKTEDDATEVEPGSAVKVKKSKKRKAGDEGAEHASSGDSKTELKEKKRKRKGAEEEQGEGEKADGMVSKRVKKKKRKHEKEDDLIVTSIGEMDGANEGAEDAMDIEPVPKDEDGSEKAKEEKRRKEGDEGKSKDKKKKSKSSVEATQVDEKSDSKEKKKKKNKKKNANELTDLPNPESDGTLSDQARKALLYAYVQFNDPPNWKFNKARQNWLIRNIWSDQAIPSLYLPLLTRYLANVQGGVRENLIKTCQTQLASASITAGEAAETDNAPKTSDQDDKDKAKDEGSDTSLVERQARANAILAVLSS